MGEWREFARLSQFTLNYRVVLLATFALTVIVDVSLAVEVGLVLASLFFIWRVSALTRIDPTRLPADLQHLQDGRVVAAYRIFGSLFFGSVAKLEALLASGNRHPDVLVLELHQVINLDTTGLHMLQTLQRSLQLQGCRLVLAELNEQPASLMHRAGFLKTLGEHNVFESLDDALRSLRLEGKLD
jgi:sulfate permease, SulP family